MVKNFFRNFVGAMKFSEIVGHNNDKQFLRRLVDEDHFPHALLISGRAGIGKLMLARALAQYIHCTNHIDGDSCGVCENCRQHETNNHPDMKFVFPIVKSKTKKVLVSDDCIDAWKQFIIEDPYARYDKWLEFLDAGNSQPRIYVDESNDIVYKVNLSNYSSKYKVILMWLPEKMTEEAANKILKILEEPNPDTRFILVSNNPMQILPTIYSRTQRVGLKPPSQDEVAVWLQTNYSLDEASAREVARISSGNIPMALDNISYGTESGQFRENFQNMMRMAYARDIRKMKEWSESISTWGREKLCRYIDYVSRMLRENYVYNLGNTALLSLNPEETTFSSKFARFVNDNNAEGLMKETEEAKRDISRNANAKIVLFDYLINLILLVRNGA